MACLTGRLFALLGKILGKSTTKEQAAARELTHLSEEIEGLRKEVARLRELVEKRCWLVKHFHVAQMDVRELTILLESITVDQLGGTLNVGINQRGPQEAKDQPPPPRTALAFRPPEN